MVTTFIHYPLVQRPEKKEKESHHPETVKYRGHSRVEIEPDPEVEKIINSPRDRGILSDICFYCHPCCIATQ